MNFGEYFEKYLLNDSSIQNKIRYLEEKEKACDNIFKNYDYINYLVNCLKNNEKIVNLDFFYFAVKEFLEINYYFEFYDYKYFVIRYRGYFIEFNYLDEIYCNFIDISNKFVDFDNIINKKESVNKETYFDYFNKLESIKKVIPKKLIKEKLDL